MPEGIALDSPREGWSELQSDTERSVGALNRNGSFPNVSMSPLNTRFSPAFKALALNSINRHASTKDERLFIQSRRFAGDVDRVRRLDFERIEDDGIDPGSSLDERERVHEVGQIRQILHNPVGRQRGRFFGEVRTQNLESFGQTSKHCSKSARFSPSFCCSCESSFLFVWIQAANTLRAE